MKDNKFYWAAIVVVVTVGILLFVNRTGMPLEDAPVIPAGKTPPPVAVSEPSVAMVSPGSAVQKKPVQVAASGVADTSSEYTLNERLSEMQKRRPEQQFDSALVAAAVQRPSAWAPAEEVPEDLPLQPEEFTDGRQFIELDSLKIETLMPGDDVKIAIEETGQEYTVSVDRVEKHDYNSISWYGSIQGADGNTYSVSFTRGEKLTVGGLDTPEGHYVLQAHGNKGWIASSGLLFKIDPNVEDAIYPHEVEQDLTHAH